MTIDEAIQCAIDDFALIESAARNAQMAMTDRTGSLLLVDGSQYSPSWRAMRGGAHVHDEGDDLGDCAQAYDEQLEEMLGQWSGRHEETLSWENGCLFIFGAAFDFEQLA